MKDKTLLIIVPGRDASIRNATFNILVAETGEGLASHFCSNYGFAYDDLYYTRPERIKEWTKRFGELEVKFVDETDLTEEILIERNKQWYKELKVNQ